MNKKSLKKLIIIVLLLMIILISAIFIINNSKQKDEEVKYTESGNVDESNFEIDYKTSKVSNATNFYTVENCINLYIDAVQRNNAEEIYNDLSQKYINDNIVTINNLYNHINKNVSKITAKEMYYIDGQTTQKYIARVVNSNNSEEFYIVNLDTSNMTFSVEPILYKNFNSISEITLENDITSIEDKGNNKFTYIRYTEEDMSYKYYNYYKDLLLNNKTEAYNLLDEEYKNAKFTDINDFVKYINSNEENLKNSILSKYAYRAKGDKNEYVLVDSNDTYIIIEEEAVMNFKVKLDDYTIPSDEYKAKYTTLSDYEKLSSNIQLVMLMINNKDYRAVYSKLDETFKANNFNTLEKFEAYMKKNMFNYNLFINKNVKQEGNVFISTGTIKSGATVAAQEKEMSIIMQMKDGTDFVMSFNIK